MRISRRKIAATSLAVSIEDLLSPSAGNIIKNYWPEFLPVVHLWGAMELFTLPDPTDSTVIRLDLATKHPQLEPVYSEGWRGILQVAQGLFDDAAEAHGFPEINRQALWCMAESSEKRKNSTLCRELDVALPIECNRKEQRAVTALTASLAKRQES